MLNLFPFSNFSCIASSFCRTVGSGTVERPPELQGVSVKDMVRVMGESRVNGNASPSPSPVLGRKSGVVTTVNPATSRSLSVSRPERSSLFSGFYLNLYIYFFK